MPHRFKIGQIVDLRRAPRLSNRLGGTCEIIHCLPHDRGPVLYRVKSLGETYERVVEEADLLISSAAKRPFEVAEAAFSIAISKR